MNKRTLSEKENKILEGLKTFEQNCRDSYRDKNGQPAHIPNDMLTLSMTYEIKRLNNLYE